CTALCAPHVTELHAQSLRARGIVLLSVAPGRAGCLTDLPATLQRATPLQAAIHQHRTATHRLAAIHLPVTHKLQVRASAPQCLDDDTILSWAMVILTAPPACLQLATPPRTPTLLQAITRPTQHPTPPLTLPLATPPLTTTRTLRLATRPATCMAARRPTTRMAATSQAMVSKHKGKGGHFMPPAMAHFAPHHHKGGHHKGSFHHQQHHHHHHHKGGHGGDFFGSD
ncbi:hypothetical protein QJQ45_028933, partial [Haematococcus lacustris]